ncbi:MAG: glycosyltransferase [Candidatus Omnitrophota bacterium]
MEPRKIRVLMLTTDSEICGTERIILSLLRHIDRSRFEPSLVTLFGPGDLIDAAKEWGVPGVNLKLREESLWKGLAAWRRLLREFQPDVIQSLLIHSNLLGRLTVLFRRKIKLLSGISTVYTVEGYGRLYAWIERLTHPLDTLYVVNSELGLDKVLHLIRLPGKKIALVHNGIETTVDEGDSEKLRCEVRREFGLAENHLVAGIVAQMRPAKRHDLLIQAAARLKMRFPELRLLFVGQGEMESALRDLAEKEGVAEETIFAGYRHDARRILYGMDIFALPSDVEGEPVSLMEAMDAGLPVITARTGGIPEIVEEGKSGLIFTPKDLDGLEIALAELLNDGDRRRRIGQAAKNRIREAFSAERMTAQFEDLYQRCMQS